MPRSLYTNAAMRIPRYLLSHWRLAFLLFVATTLLVYGTGSGIWSDPTDGHLTTPYDNSLEAVQPAELTRPCPGIFQETYGARHRAFIAGYMEDGAGQHDDARGVVKPLVGSLVLHVVNKMSGGWGNRLRAMSTLFYLAVLTDRALFVNWTTPEPLERYFEPTPWFDWRVSAAPPRLQAEFATAYQHAHRWNHDAVVADNFDRVTFFRTVDFDALLNRTHEAVLLMYDAASLLMDNALMAHRVDSVFSPLWRQKAHPLRPWPMFRDPRMFGCAANFLLRPTAHHGQVLAERIRHNLVRVVDWTQTGTLASVAAPPLLHPHRAQFPVAVHLRLGDHGDQVALAATTEARVACHFAAVSYAREHYYKGSSPFAIYLATDQPRIVANLIPTDLRPFVWLQDTRNLTSRAKLNINFGNVPDRFALTVVDFTVLAYADVLVANFTSTFASSAARWSWIHPRRKQISLDVGMLAPTATMVEPGAVLHCARKPAVALVKNWKPQN